MPGLPFQIRHAFGKRRQLPYWNSSPQPLVPVRFLSPLCIISFLFLTIHWSLAPFLLPWFKHKLLQKRENRFIFSVQTSRMFRRVVCQHCRRLVLVFPLLRGGYLHVCCSHTKKGNTTPPFLECERLVGCSRGTRESVREWLGVSEDASVSQEVALGIFGNARYYFLLTLITSSNLKPVCICSLLQRWIVVRRYRCC